MKKCEPFNNWCNGFTGRHACHYFLEQGFHVIPMFQNRAHREKLEMVLRVI